MIRALLIGLTLAAASAAAAVPVSGEAGEDVVRLRGTLVPAEKAAPAPDHDRSEHDSDAFAFESPDGERFRVTVEGDHWHILNDPQLAERLWELEGRWLADGLFAARKIFTVKDGDLYEVTYYCEICNIVSYRPGRCMCCQQDVELREIPAEQP